MPAAGAPIRPSEANLVPVRANDPIVRHDRAPRALDCDDRLRIAGRLAESDEEAGRRSLQVVSTEIWNFVDGERTVGEIADAVGSCPTFASILTVQ
jgi:hypothetical protein